MFILSLLSVFSPSFNMQFSNVHIIVKLLIYNKLRRFREHILIETSVPEFIKLRVMRLHKFATRCHAGFLVVVNSEVREATR